MKYLYSWLKTHYSDLPPLDKLEEVLIQLGHDVESIDRVTYQGVVVAEIQAIEKHPQADRLSLVTITSGKDTQRVVCGAPNITIGQRVAYAAVGVTLPSGIVLKQAKIRGEMSHGMLLAEDELGLGPSHETLLPLPHDAIVGDPITNYLPEEAVISLDITSDRGDVLSHFGLARDIKAAVHGELLIPQFELPRYHGETNELVTIGQIHDDVQAFSLGLVSSGQPAPPTPIWMQSRLVLLGHKSINLATNLTNYFMLEYGQPLHAYDVDKLDLPAEFGIRRAHNGEHFQGLNGKTYSLTPQALVITANDTPVALAGILGGDETKVTSVTTRVLFESAHFYPKPIRVMARGLNCLTEGAIRWERGVDPILREKILAHIQAVYSQLTQGTATQPVTQTHTAHQSTTMCNLVLSQMNALLGTQLSLGEVTKYLTALGCIIEQNSDTEIGVRPPYWRPDLQIPEDYYEELVRMIGTEHLPKQPLPASVPQWKRSKWWRQEALKDILVGLGATEISTYPFVNEQEVSLWPGKKSAVVLTAPAQEGKDRMRTSLIPGMLQAFAANPEAPTIVMFEIAKVYSSEQETEMLCIGTASNSQTELDDWWQHLFERLRLPVGSWMARVQTITDEIIDSYKIRKSGVLVLTLPVSDFLSNRIFDNPTVIIPELDDITYAPISKFQASRRDIAFVVDRSITVETISKDLLSLDPYIIAVELFDTYTDSKLGENNYSLAFHLSYQAPDRTLTAEEINALHSKVETYVQEHYHGTIR